MKQLFTTAIALVFWGTVQAQSVADFENLNLPTNSFWDGSAAPLGTQFQSGEAMFRNFFDTSFGGYWSQGWAYSSVNDSTTAGYTNLFAARAFTGFGLQGTYAVGQQNSVVVLNTIAKGKVVAGLYVTNTTYAYLSMRDGDGFAKKFGGTTGNDPDFFLLKIGGWYQGQPIADSIAFYLADFRFSDNTQDYIISDWTWVDLTALGNADSLAFSLTSTDNSGGWMNTPSFFAIDNLTTTNSGLNLTENQVLAIGVYPNPATAVLNFNNPTSQQATARVFAFDGRMVTTTTIQPTSFAQLDVNNWPKGIYLVHVTVGHQTTTTKIIVQ